MPSNQEAAVKEKRKLLQFIVYAWNLIEEKKINIWNGTVTNVKTLFQIVITYYEVTSVKSIKSSNEIYM